MADDAGNVVGATEQLLLHKLNSDHADFLLTVLNDPDFMRYVGDRGVRTAAQAAAYIEARIAPAYRDYGYGMYRVARKSDGAAVGICGLVRRAGLEAPDLGFAFLPAFRGRGFAAESAARVLQLARTDFGIKRVLAIVAPDNEPSVALLERLGMNYDRPTTLPGTDALLHVYAIGDD